MAVVNLAWSTKFFWDGRAKSLRDQALGPVPNVIEMHLSWVDAVARLQHHPEYVALFKKAFDSTVITKELTTKAIEQFEKTLISYNSPYDKYIRGEANLTLSEQRGLVIFNTEAGDCFHCHTTPELFVHPTKVFTNNGMDAAATPDDFADKGLGAISGNPLDNGKFKIPSLRNLAYSAPYMHDGRFQTLEEVIDSYDLGPKQSPSVDSILIVKATYRLENYGHWGLALTPQDKDDLKNFLLSLSDSSFIH
jgi:cytochrome c peroxidase